MGTLTATASKARLACRGTQADDALVTKPYHLLQQAISNLPVWWNPYCWFPHQCLLCLQALHNQRDTLSLPDFRSVWRLPDDTVSKRRSYKSFPNADPARQCRQLPYSDGSRPKTSGHFGKLPCASFANGGCLLSRGAGKEDPRL